MSYSTKHADTLNDTAPNSMEFNKIYNQQLHFQQRLQITPSVESMKDQIMCLIAEATEALNELPWKHWKKNQVANIPKFQDELVDVQLFLLNLTAMSGMTIDQFLVKCADKQQINTQRQKDNY